MFKFHPETETARRSIPGLEISKLHFQWHQLLELILNMTCNRSEYVNHIKRVLYIHSTPFQLRYQLKVNTSGQSIIVPYRGHLSIEKQKLQCVFTFLLVV
jgi:hypothetical protein